LDKTEKDFDARRWIDQFEKAGFQSIIFYSKFHDGICMGLEVAAIKTYSELLRRDNN